MPAFSLVADYHQFYLFDDDACPPYPDPVFEADLERRVKALPNLLALYTLADTGVAVVVESHPSAPPLDNAAWGHVVEASLNLPSGRMVLASPTSFLPGCPRVEVSPGMYRVRIASQDSGNGERYLVSIWPGATAPVAVIKSSGHHGA